MWFFPWEKWLPVWIIGPALCIGSIAALVFDRSLHWREYILLPLVALLGAWATYVWLKEGRNIFREADPPAHSKEKERS